MAFDASAYGEAIAKVLALDGNGQRLMPLVQGACSSEAARQLLIAAGFAPLVKAGLYLYFGCWTEAHETAQDIPSAEGSYWHAIVHRQEPDEGNAGYWFRQVGTHPIFPALRSAAAAAGVDFGPQWDPFAFVAYCERARSNPGCPEEQRALQVQLAEWQLLFDHCAR